MQFIIKDIFTSSIWRTKNLLSHIGEAKAPMLWDFDSYGYARPFDNRPISAEEAAWLADYNETNSRLNEMQRKGLDDFLRKIFPLTWPPENPVNPDGPDRFGDAENTVSPLILDLNGDGVKTLNKTAGKHFDHAGDGFAERTGWVDKDDGLLVRDLNGDGKITSGRELFGNHTLLKNGINAGKQAANGFEALKDLDSNADGLVDDKDTAFASLRVWKDTNGNGLTDTGELLSLAQAGVKSLKVGYTDAGSNAPADAQGNQHQQLGTFTQTDGSTQNMHDVGFATSSWDTIDQRSPLALSAAIAALPEMEGRGTLGSLHQAMGRDAKNESHYLRRYS